MKKLLLFLIAAVPAIATAEETKAVKSDIQSITVYQQGAEITRTTAVSVPAGYSEIVFEGLTNYVNEQTIQVAAAGNLTILSAVYQRNYVKAQEKSPDYIIIQDSLKYYEYELAKILNQKETLQQEQDMLVVNKKVSGEETGLSVDALKQAVAFFRQRFLEIKNELLELSLKEQFLQKRKQSFQNQLNQFNNRQIPSGEIVVKIFADNATKANFKLNYFTPQASWQPVYDIRVEDVASPVKLSYKAKVQQSTGVDWNKVDLILTTGNPVVSNTAPDLQPWYLNFYYPNQGYIRGARSDAATTIVDGVKVREAEDYSAQPPPVQVQENQLNVSFDIDVPYSIPSDNKGHLVMMKDYTLPADYRYLAIPKLDKDAFLQAKITDWEQFNILPGQANIFFEGAYVGNTFIDPNITNDTLNISLGRDKSIVVKREKVEEFSKEKTIGDKIKREVMYEISVRNTKSKPITIEVLDQYPVSQQNEIKVELKETSGARVNEQTGELKWILDLSRGEAKTIRFSFNIEYPKDKLMANF